MERRPDFAQVVRGGVGAFRAGHAEPGDEALRVVEIMIADPGERQIGEHFVAVGQIVERDGVARRRDAALAAQHDALGSPRRARGVEDHRGVLALAGADARVERGGDARVGERLAARRHHRVEGMEPRLAVIAQAALLVVNDMRQIRQPGGDGEDLVDLLLILRDDEFRPGVVEHESQLVGDRIGVDRDGNGAEHLGRRDGPVEARAVGADDGDAVALS